MTDWLSDYANVHFNVHWRGGGEEKWNRIGAPRAASSPAGVTGHRMRTRYSSLIIMAVYVPADPLVTPWKVLSPLPSSGVKCFVQISLLLSRALLI